MFRDDDTAWQRSFASECNWHACDERRAVPAVPAQAPAFPLRVSLSMLCAGALSMLAGCGKAVESSYFPVAKGTEWIYEVATEMSGQTSRELQVIRALGQQENDGEKLAVRRSELGRTAGVEYLLRVSEQGVTRVGQRTDLQDIAVRDETPRPVLKYPLKPGVGWNAPTVPYTILRANEYPRELKYGKPIMMSYSVESIDEQVTVPAGTYNKCAKILGQATLTLYTDPVNGFAKVPVTTTEWYCPGVGLVKLERVEKLATAFFTGGSVRMTLSGFRTP